MSGDWQVLSHEYRVRWFELTGNLLFYFKSETKTVRRRARAARLPAEAPWQADGPVGVVLLENCVAEPMPRAPPDFAFVFKITFSSADSREYMLKCPDEVAGCVATPRRKPADGRRRQESLQGWVRAVNQASYSTLKALVAKLQVEVFAAECRAPRTGPGLGEADADAAPRGRRSPSRGRNALPPAGETAEDVATLLAGLGIDEAGPVADVHSVVVEAGEGEGEGDEVAAALRRARRTASEPGTGPAAEAAARASRRFSHNQ